jgi:hypothetical protein
MTSPMTQCSGCGCEFDPDSPPGTFTQCTPCDCAKIDQAMIRYAVYGTRSTGKHPGMTFPSGGTIPTPEDTRWAIEMLVPRESGS